MADGISLCSLVAAFAPMVIAIVALCIAWDLRCKTTQHIFTITQVSSAEEQSITHPNGFHYFELYIKNLGLPFPKMSVVLGFYGKNCGYFLCRLRAIDILSEHSTDTADNVATGLVVKFGWRSYEMDSSTIQFLCSLENLREQRAALSIYCAGYRVKNIQFGSRKERMSICWRNVLFSIGRWLKLGFYAKNQKSWQARIRLPDSQTLSTALMFFLHNLRLPPKHRNT